MPIPQFIGQDDPHLTVMRRDISGGQNTRQHGTVIAENQVETVTNADLTIPGQSQKRKGTNLIEDLGDNNAGTSAIGFEPLDGTEELIVTHGQKVEGWIGGVATFTEHKTDITTDGAQTKLLQAFKSGGDGSVLLISNGTDDIEEMDQDHAFTTLTDDGDDGPPKGSRAMAFYRGRFWILKDNVGYFSDAYPSNFAEAFDQTTNGFNIPVGQERAIIPLRDSGLVFLGQESIYAMNPSMVPSPFDRVEKMLDIGCVADKSAVQVGDDIYFLAHDGVRGLFRTQQDKIQLGQSVPLSYQLKDSFESISWGYINKATAIWFDNKYMLALPTAASTYNNTVWVYFPATGAWTTYTGWSVGDWARVTFDGEDLLYYIDGSGTADGVYQAWTQDVDEDVAGTQTAITYTEIGRKEDGGQPFKKKFGGELTVRCEATSGDLTVSAEIDDGGYSELGTMSLSGNLLTFPVTFPVSFAPPNVAFGKFHLDGLGSWYYMQYKLTHSATDTVKVLERSLATHLDSYTSDDSA